MKYTLGCYLLNVLDVKGNIQKVYHQIVGTLFDENFWCRCKINMFSQKFPVIVLPNIEAD